MAGDSSEHACKDHFRRWLTGMGAACEFAAKSAAKRGFTCYTHTAPDLQKSDLPGFDGFIAQRAKDGHVAHLLFPHIRSVSGIVRMLQILDGGERWSVRRLDWKEHPRNYDLLLSLEWDNGDYLSSAVGFAPVGSMPATRRSPYVAISIWGGMHQNPHRNRSGKYVGMADVPNVKELEKHDTMWDASKARTRGILADPPEDVPHLRKAAFCLPLGAVKKGLFL